MARMVDRRLRADVGDFRLFSRRAVLAIRSFREQHRFMRGLVAWLGLKEAILPFERHAALHYRPPKVEQMSDHIPNNRSGVWRVGTINALMNREYAGTITSTSVTGTGSGSIDFVNNALSLQMTVGADGQRFIDETTTSRHGKAWMRGTFDFYPGFPMWTIFDERARLAGADARCARAGA